MQIKSTIRKLCYGCLVVLISSCAVITAPTGGPRDTTPPKVLKENPPNKSVNFSSKNIEITFDEFVQVQNAQNIVISPAMDPQPEFMAKRSTLTIKFKKPLEPNTTYSIFFGSNVGDANENNILQNYSYVFSTGSFLDSLRVKGLVKTADGTIPDNSFLLLYKEKEDSAFLKKRPFYLAKIEKDGSFQLEHVKAGNYRAYSLSDKNLNYYYDLPTELIGFTDSAITITGNYDSLSLPLFLPEENKLRVMEHDKTISGGIFNFTLNKEISFTKDELKISVKEDTSIQTAAFQEADNKHIKVYITKIDKDSGSYTLYIKNNSELIDSFRVKLESRNFLKPVVYFTDSAVLKNLTVMETQALKLPSPYYGLAPVDTSGIVLLDSSKLSIPFAISRDADLKTYLVTAEWKDKMRYQLVFQDSTLIDLAGNYNQKQTVNFSGLTHKKAGNLLLRVELPDVSHNSIIILKDNTGKVLNTRVVRDSQSVSISYGLLPAGAYSLEVVDDINNNGIWNSGNFYNHTLPEKIFKYDKPIMIKENWDAEETIKVDYTTKSIRLPEINPRGEKDSSSKEKLPELNKKPGKIMKE